MGPIDYRISKIKEEYQKKIDVLKSENAILRDKNLEMEETIATLRGEADG